MPIEAQQAFPSQPILLEPANGATIPFPGTSNPVTFRWSSVIGATRYQISGTVDSIPSVSEITTQTSANINLNLPPSNKSRVVRWSVRSGDDNEFSNSQPGSFTFIISSTVGFTPTIPPAPSATPTPFVIPLTKPELLLPADGENISRSAAFTGINYDWKDVSGADKYIVRIYKDNEIFRQTETGVSQLQRISIQTVLFDVFQWDVEAVQNRTGKTVLSERYSFSIGAGDVNVPTPTPIPQTADINHDQKMDARDVLLFASLFLTNAPTGDLNNSGIQDRLDMLRFLELFAAGQ